ncbi:MAG: hypoxanthine phosphoribosyltransferase [Planctomycetota bacterium]
MAASGKSGPLGPRAGRAPGYCLVGEEAVGNRCGRQVSALATEAYNPGMQKDLARILITRDQIKQRVSEMARAISEVYGEDSKGLVIVPILSGSIIFLADLIRYLPFKMRIGLMTASSYRGATTEGGEVRLVQDSGLDIAGRHVLVLDDVLDTGNTLRAVMRQLKRQDPASLRMCVLLRKVDKAPKDLLPDFVGFDIEDVFVVGYGLDYNDHYRNWPDIGVLRRELYA